MGPRTNEVVGTAAKWILLGAVMLLAIPGYAGDARSGTMGQPEKHASAKLTISVIVVPIVQTSAPTASRKTADSDVVYNFAPQHFEQRYELRNLQIDNGSGSTAQALLRTLAIVPQ